MFQQWITVRPYLLIAGITCVAALAPWHGGVSFGQEAAVVAEEAEAAKEAKPASAAPAAEPELNKGDNAWMLTSSALVLFMTVPGLAMFYGGLVRKKNVLSVLMQCMFLMGMMTVIWGTVGYSLSFGGTGAWIGNGDYFWMEGVQTTWTSSGIHTPMVPELGIPRLTHMLFQGMFFIITPALICGAFAERMKFSAMVVYSAIWGIVVYCPLCHWVWGMGILAYGSEHAKGIFAGGALDFAGRHGGAHQFGRLGPGLLLGDGQATGLSARTNAAAQFDLYGAWCRHAVGRLVRLQRRQRLAADGVASSAFAATHFSAAAGTVAWAITEWIHRGKPTMLGAASGAVAGLVCITPASGFVTPMPAILMGAMAGVMCCFTVSVMKSKLGYDDSSDAFGVHGLGGTLGAILTGVFASRAVFDIGKGAKLGLLEGGNVLTAQIVATVVSWTFAAVVSVVLLKLIDMTIGLRVSSEEEVEGLDVSQHGEEGYIFL